MAPRAVKVTLVLPILLIVVAGHGQTRTGAPGDAVADRILGQAVFSTVELNRTDARSLFFPVGVALDTHVTPNRLYVSDANNSRILAWRDAQGFRSGAPADLVIGQPDVLHSDCNGGGVTARSLCFPRSIAIDGLGNLYVADSGNYRVLEYDAPFEHDAGADRVIGQPDFTTAQSRCAAPDGLCNVDALALDAAGNLFVGDPGGVLEYDRPLATDTLFDRVFGRTARGAPCPDSEPCVERIGGIALSPQGDLFISDAQRHDIRIYRAALATDALPDGAIGDCDPVTGGGVCGPSPNDADFRFPGQLAWGGDGRLYVVDQGRSRILGFSDPLASEPHADRVLGGAGGFSSAASSCLLPRSEGALLCVPTAIAVDAAGTAFVADGGNCRVLRFLADAGVHHLDASAVLGQPGLRWNGLNGIDRRGMANPIAVAVDLASNPHPLYVLDAINSRVLGWRDARSFDDGQPADLWIGQADPFSGLCNAGRGTAPNAGTLCLPAVNAELLGGLAVDRLGNLYVTDVANHCVLEYDAPFRHDAVADRVYGQPGFVSNLCNQGGLSALSLCLPQGVALDARGNLYIADAGNHRVVVYLDPLRETRRADRVIGQRGFGRRHCAATIDGTGVCHPAGLALGPAGELWVADRDHNRVLRFPRPLETSPGPVRADLVLGQGGSFDTGDCLGGAIEEALCQPAGLAADGAGNLWVADLLQHRVVRFDRLGRQPTIGAVLGAGPENGGFPYSAVSLYAPAGVAVDATGEVFVADRQLNRVLAFERP